MAPDGTREALGALVARHRGGVIRRTARTGHTFGASRLAKASFGAVFAEVAVDPVTLEMRVERLLGAFACGRIVEPVIARNQLEGGMVWGLGQALFEESRLDRRTGRWTNANLAEALIATQADAPDPEVIFVPEDDTAAHPLGIKSLAEIGLVGPAPAIANAIYDATGRRLRSLPMLLEHRLARGPPSETARMRTLRPKTAFSINGTSREVDLDPRTTLIDLLREELGLTGTKKGCDHGQCGACTVLVDGRRVLSCLTLAATVRGSVTTIEGIGGEGGALHPMQAAFLEHNAFQCGYCTPEQIMSAIACVNEGRAGSADEVRAAMSGNLCRCSAYGNIVRAVLDGGARMEAAE